MGVDVNVYAFKHWLESEIRRLEHEYQKDVATFTCDDTVGAYYQGRLMSLYAAYKMLTGRLPRITV